MSKATSREVAFDIHLPFCERGTRGDYPVPHPAKTTPDAIP